jgi:hypothetical protein
MTGIKSRNFRPLVLYQGPLGSTLHPVMAGLDPAIGHPHQFANDAIPVSNHPDRDGRVKPSQDGSGGACGTSTARAAGIRSARRANNLYSVKLRVGFTNLPRLCIPPSLPPRLAHRRKNGGWMPLFVMAERSSRAPEAAVRLNWWPRPSAPRPVQVQLLQPR